tara:strand:- start:2887 stop:3054 length:168 start_codon:yes stop_codon:yes gene_type:complete
MDGFHFALGAIESALLHFREELESRSVVRVCLSGAKTRRAPRGGVAKNFRQEIYL